MGTINLKTNFQRVACIDATKYVTTAVRYSTIGQEELIMYASDNSGIPRAQMAAAFYAIMQQIEQFVLNGHSLALGTLGSFYLSTHAKVKDVESEAGANAVIGLHLRFRQSKKIRDYLKNNVILSTVKLQNTKTEKPDGDGGGSSTGNGNTDGDMKENPLG